MFQESLVESSPMLRSQNRWPALLAFALQCALAAAMLAIPLLHPELLPARLTSTSLHAPVPPVPKPPEPPRAVTRVVPISMAAMLGTPTVPSPAAEGARALLNLRGPAVDLGTAPPLGSATGLNGSSTGLPTGLTNSAPASPRVSVRPANTTTRISSGVSAGLLLAPIRPAYPAIARATRVEGSVVIEALISRVGSIESAHAISGPPMLQGAALAAVRSAHYRPFLLNGETTEVQTTITVSFHLGS